jgi:hypothetical protein
MEKLYRGDGKSISLKVECWQHDPYRVYCPVTSEQMQKIETFSADSAPVEKEDGRLYPTSGEPLAWGSYGATVVPMIAKPGKCPHC